MECQYRSKLDPSYSCREPTEAQTNFCIFHSPSPDPSEFKRRLKEQIEGRGKNPPYSFLGYRFPVDWGQWVEVLSENTFEGLTNFSEAQFKGDADFEGAKFNRDVLFLGAQFNGDALFTLAIFRGDAIFQKAHFNRDANFHVCVFKKVASFLNAEFRRAAHFTGEFCEDAVFRKAQFSEVADFVHATFLGEVDFTLAQFYKDAIFEGAEFYGDTDFSGARFYGNANFFCSFTKKASFAGASFLAYALFAGCGAHWLFERGADFSRVQLVQPERITFNHVNLSQCQLRGTDVRALDFVDVRWASKELFSILGRKYGKRHALYDELVSLEEKDWEALPEVEKLYRQLTHNYEQARNYSLAGHFHYGAMEMVRKQYRSWWRRNIFSLVAWYRYLAGYGERPSWPLIILGGIWLLLAVGFYFFHPTGEGWKRFAWALLYSAQALVLRGALEGASGWAQVVAFAGSILGPMQIAFFLIAIRRRFRR